MRSADVIVELLIANDVEVVFGVPGDTSVCFHNAFEKYRDRIDYLTCRDERHAAYMADAYARVSGRPGVVDVPSGGGLLYAAPGLSEATSSSIPLICISSDISMTSEGTGALTELNQIEVSKPITKWNAQIKMSSKIPQTIKKAFRIATSGRPGAVHLSIPENIHEEDYNFSQDELIASGQKFLRNSPNDKDVEKTCDSLSEASHPVILAGGGVHLSDAYKQLEEFSRRFAIPVATSINGKGSIAEVSPQSIGVVGVNGGTKETTKILQQSDFILVLGSKLNNVTTVAKSIFDNSPNVIQVDISEEILDLNVNVNLSVMCDIQSFLLKLNEMMDDRHKNYANQMEDWNNWCQTIVKEKFNDVSNEVQVTTSNVNPAKIISLLDEMTDENSLFVVDAGTANPYMASNYKTKKSGRKAVFDRGHGNLGYALSAAMGAQVAKPQSKVISLIGDGSFAMSVGELETAYRLKLPIVFLHFQNSSYGWIKKLHQLYYKEHYIAVDFDQFDGAKIAEGFGIPNKKIKKNSELKQGLVWALSQDGPVFLDITIEPITNIIPPVINWRADSQIDPKDRKALTY